MVESTIIKDKYIQLLELVKIEAGLNASIWEYYNYLSSYKDKFSAQSNLLYKQDLKEFLRGASRYSDEFVFSNTYYSEIREATNTLYSLLNSESPI